jgi:hypothetical protein
VLKTITRPIRTPRRPPTPADKTLLVVMRDSSSSLGQRSTSGERCHTPSASSPRHPWRERRPRP